VGRNVVRMSAVHVLRNLKIYALFNRLGLVTDGRS